MNISPFNYIAPDIILADVIKLVDDEGYLWNTKGWYISQIQQCLSDLAFETYFDVRDTVVRGEVWKDSLRFPMPQGAFNIRQIYAFNGEECNIQNAANVYWKRNYITRGNGYLARHRGSQNGNDPFYPGGSGPTVRRAYEDRNKYASSESGLYFYNIQNGYVMLSASCRNFENIFIVFNGTGCDIGEVPFIPEQFRNVTKDFVAETALRLRMAQDDNAKWNRLWSIYDRNLNRHEYHGDYKGSWYKAELFAKSLDNAAREAIKEYMSKGGW